MYARASDGDIFAMILKTKNITIKELAEKTDIPIQTLYTLKKRKTNLTDPETKKRIAEALDFSEKVWDMSSEEVVLNIVFGEPASTQKIETVEADLLTKAMALKKIDPEFVKHALEFIGAEDISLPEIKEILYDGGHCTQQLKRDLEFVILNGKQILSRAELDILRQIRSFEPKTKDDFLVMMTILSDADKARKTAE